MKKDYKISNKDKLTKELIREIKLDPKREHAMIGVCEQLPTGSYKVIESTILNQSDNPNNKFYIKIPKPLSIKLIKLCVGMDLIPIIIHTHVFLDKDNNVTFSKTDMKFIKKFSIVARQMGLKSGCLFLVTNGVYYELCWDNSIHSASQRWSLENDL